ncbi:transmembrane prolyl 4-hydroxylase [Exaiptasia diaphana]|uniref:Transmembrane prolyl 4-hydroxylase-like n=1 Tax=Exaiptasia diaphana TaxID=2652724 RepID=A0A913WNW6_EXADI|nr:transmembrane prolyl 4-hydroxylase [Exaiptasia diaphana]
MDKYIFIHITGIIFLVLHGFVRSTELPSCECSEGDKDSCKKERLHLALPYINPVKVGHEQTIETSNGKTFNMRTLSLSPPIFEIPNFFTSEECDYVIEMAKKRGMSDSPVLKDKRIFQNETTEEVFNTWDVNNDGFVDMDEMMMLRGNSNLYITDEDIATMFEKLGIDKDEDGKMNFEEFQEVTAEGFKNYFDRLRREVKSLQSRNSKQTWMWHDEDELLMYEDLLEDYHDRFAKITGLPTKMVKENEPLQVVQYPEKGHYHCHYDSDVINKELPCCVYGSKKCRFCRYLTVAVFLNDVESGGELAFPVADNATYNWEVWTKESYTNCNMVKHCANSNVVVKPKAGTAVLFYNHLYDKTSQWSSALDPRSLVGECQVNKGEKWIAFSWMSVPGDGINELKSWKMGSNWLSINNRNMEVLSSLEANYKPTEEITENRYTREKNTRGDASKHSKETIHKAIKESDTGNHNTKETLGESSENIEGPEKLKKESEVEITTEHYDALEGINMKEIKKEFLTQQENKETEPSTSSSEGESSKKDDVKKESLTHTENKETEPSTSSSKQKSTKEDIDLNAFPKGPEVHLGSTPAPLPLPQEKMTLKEPIEPKLDSEPLPPVEGHRVLKSIMLLIDELDQVELEIVARNLHSRLKLVCVPLMINPMGTLR